VGNARREGRNEELDGRRSGVGAAGVLGLVHEYFVTADRDPVAVSADASDREFHYLDLFRKR
jgi:hypothetical protein